MSLLAWIIVVAVFILPYELGYHARKRHERKRRICPDCGWWIKAGESHCPTSVWKTANEKTTAS